MMRRHWVGVIVASVAFSMVGCDGGGPPAGMPEDPQKITPAPTAPFMGGNMAKKSVPKPGTEGSGAAPATK